MKSPLYLAVLETLNSSIAVGVIQTHSTVPVNWLKYVELSKDAEPIFLIINKIKQPITLENKSGLQYKVNVISETRKIINHKVQGTQQENGIVFKVNNKEVFKPVNFKLK